MNLITSKISMDLMTMPEELPVIYAVQGERDTRAVQLSLFCGGSPWQISEGMHLAVRYGRVGQGGGYYDTLSDGACAYSYEGNNVTVILASQMMAVAGSVIAQVELIQGDQMLATFSFKVMVAVNPAVGIVERENYINWQNWLEQELDAYIKKLNQSGQLVGGTMAGPIHMNGYALAGLSAPTENDHATNMGYVNRELEKIAFRPNQLDNWYFVNPVNQRGIASDAGWNSWYGLDRWKALYNNAVKWNSAGYLEMPQGFDNCIIEQYFERGFGNEQVTVSILCRDGILYADTVNWNESAEVQLFNGTVFSGSGVGFIQGKQTFRLWRQKDYSADIKIVAVKLELGSTQTLARKVNGEWKLNDIPNFWEQYAKCRRYYIANEVTAVSNIAGDQFMASKIINMRDMGNDLPTINLEKFTKPGVAEMRTGTEDYVELEKLDYGTYNIKLAHLPSCNNYDIGTLRFSVSADFV